MVLCSLTKLWMGALSYWQNSFQTCQHHSLHYEGGDLSYFTQLKRTPCFFTINFYTVGTGHHHTWVKVSLTFMTRFSPIPASRLTKTDGWPLRWACSESSLCPGAEGTTDCSCFAIALCVSLLYGDNPSTLVYNQKNMREHIVYFTRQQTLLTISCHSQEKQAYTSSNGTHPWLNPCTYIYTFHFSPQCTLSYAFTLILIVTLTNHIISMFGSILLTHLETALNWE